MITKTEHIVNNKKLIVYDGLFKTTELRDIYSMASQSPYIKTNFDVAIENNIMSDTKWSFMMDPMNPIYQLISKKFNIIDELSRTRFQVERSYINCSTLETVDTVHLDCLAEEKNNYTVLIYANFIWKSKWHGETIFYDDDCEEAVFVVSPKPGRLVFFDGAIPHSAIAPSRIAEYPRYTIATKILIKGK